MTDRRSENIRRPEELSMVTSTRWCGNGSAQLDRRTCLLLVGRWSADRQSLELFKAISFPAYAWPTPAKKRLGWEVRYSVTGWKDSRQKHPDADCQLQRPSRALDVQCEVGFPASQHDIEVAALWCRNDSESEAAVQKKDDAVHLNEHGRLQDGHRARWEN